MKGYVYIMTNPALKLDLLKIGWTRDLQKRLKQASGTNIPEDYVLEASYPVIDMDKAEKKIFEILKDFRYVQKKEFFLVELEYAKFVCKIVADNINNNENIKLQPIKNEEIESLVSKSW